MDKPSTDCFSHRASTFIIYLTIMTVNILHIYTCDDCNINYFKTNTRENIIKDIKNKCDWLEEKIKYESGLSTMRYCFELLVLAWIIVEEINLDDFHPQSLLTHMLATYCPKPVPKSNKRKRPKYPVSHLDILIVLAVKMNAIIPQINPIFIQKYLNIISY